MVSSLELWLSLLGSGVVTGVVGWIFGGKQAKKQELKKGDVEIKKEELDYATKEREYFQQGIEDRNNLITELKSELQNSKNEAKDERLYYREKQNELRGLIEGLQSKFNEMQVAYAKETEIANTYKMKYYELEAKYNVIIGKYTQLEQDHEALKKEFETYKAKHK